MPLQFKNIAVGNLQDDVSGNNYAANKAVYILNLNNTLAQIFSDEAGIIPIVQDGVNNVTNSKGVFGFWVDAGDYFVQVGANKYRVSITGADYFNNRVDETVNLIVDSVAGRGAYYPVGSFEAGFTYTDINQVGTFGGTDYYVYTGGLSNLPHNVTAGTVPSAPDYQQVTFGDHNALVNRDVAGAHEAQAINLPTNVSLGDFFNDFINTDSVTINIPTDYPDIQSAIDEYRKFNQGTHTNVTIYIEAGHKLTKGFECTRGDFSNIQIASADPVVYLDTNFVGVDVEQNPTNGEVPRPPLCYGFHSVMPRWNLTVDMENLYGSGLLLINCATYCSAGHGVINAGFRGWQQRAGYGFASNTNFSGATGCAARVQKAGICNLGDANLTNACKTEDQAIGALYVSRSCNVEARGADVSNSGAGGIVCRRSIVTAVDVNASNCAKAAFEAQSGGVIDAVNSTVNNPQLEAYYARFGATIIASGATVTNPNVPSRIFVNTDGATTIVNAGTTVDGVAINETHLHADVPQFNITYGNGIFYHPDKQAVVESGSNANGTWQKFADGRMVCETGIVNIDLASPLAADAYSAQIQKPTLPQTFIAVYSIDEKVVGKQNIGGGGADIFINSCSNMNATSNEFKVYNTGVQLDGTATGVAINTVQIMMKVTGTWK